MIIFQKSKYRIILGIALLILLCMPPASMPTVRAEQSNGSITLSYVISDAEFRLYKIGVTDSKGTLQLTDAFADYAVDLKSDSVARTLEAYIARDQLEPVAEAKTGDSKTLKFDNLDFAVYLLCGEPKTVGTIRYIASPALIYLPADGNGTTIKDVDVHVKYEKEEVSENKKLTLFVVWNDRGNAQFRPLNMMIQLLRDGVVFDTVELNEENNWKHEWVDLDGKYVWTVVEQEAPDGYVISRDKDGFIYVIINTREDVPEIKPTVSGSDPDLESKPPTGTPPDSLPDQEFTSPEDSSSVEDKLPQTGQLWWPVFMLISIGLLFLIIGFYCKRKDS